MNLREAFSEEMDRGRRIIYVADDSECHICHKIDECRAGVCFDCKDLVEIDMINVWEIKNPDNIWPYAWIEVKPKDVSENDIIRIDKLLGGK